MSEKVIEELVEILKNVDTFENYLPKILDMSRDDDYTNIKWFSVSSGKNVKDAVNQYIQIKDFIKKYNSIDDLLLNALMKIYPYATANQLHSRLTCGDKTFLVIDEKDFCNQRLLKICRYNDIHIVYTSDNTRFYDFIDSKKYYLYKSSCYGQCDDAASWDEVYIEEMH